MIPHHADLDAAFGTSAWRPVTKVSLLNPTDGRWRQITADVIDGEFSADASRWPRHEVDFSIPASVVPTSERPESSPWGGRVRIVCGAVVGNVERTFQVAELDVYEDELTRPDGVTRVKAVSKEARVNEARRHVLSPGTDMATSSHALAVVRGALGVDYYPYVNTMTNDKVIKAGTFDYLTVDPWQMVEDAMAANGAEAYFRWDNRLVMRDLAYVGSPVMTLKVGDGGTVTKYVSARRWVPNEILTGYRDGSGGEVWGFATDTDPASPTYRQSSAYGLHAQWTGPDSVDTLPDFDQADTRAATILRRRRSRMRRVTLECIPAPWLEPGDTVAVQLLGTGASEDLLVESVRWPLSQLGAPMTVTTQTYTYVE